MHVDDFDHLSDGEIAELAKKVRTVYEETLEDLHALRLTYLNTDWDDQAKKDETQGRIEFLGTIAEGLVNAGEYPQTIGDLVDSFEEIEAILNEISTRIGNYDPATWNFWRGYQKAGNALMVSLEEAMEVEEADPNGYED